MALVVCDKNSQVDNATITNLLRRYKADKNYNNGYLSDSHKWGNFMYDTQGVLDIC